jgi:hypothetical protein
MKEAASQPIATHPTPGGRVTGVLGDSMAAAT